MVRIRRRDLILYTTPVLVIMLLIGVILGRVVDFKTEAAEEWVEFSDLALQEEEESDNPNATHMIEGDAPADKVVASETIELENENEEKRMVENLSPNSKYTVAADELVAWAHRANDEGWEYVLGGCEAGQVDCSGLIKSCVGVCARGTEELLEESANSGTIDTIPDIPGIGVYYKGHVGIYIGDGKVIDARGETSGIGLDDISYEGWTHWFEIKGVDYTRYVTFAD